MRKIRLENFFQPWDEPWDDMRSSEREASATERSDAVGFVKECVSCGCSFTVTDEPVPDHYTRLPDAFQSRISRENYESRVSELKRGLCPECVKDPDLERYSDSELIELMLEAENRKNGHLRAEKAEPGIIDRLAELLGDTVYDMVDREKRFICQCETELERRRLRLNE